jgi:hypothetical protein
MAFFKLGGVHAMCVIMLSVLSQTYLAYAHRNRLLTFDEAHHFRVCRLHYINTIDLVAKEKKHKHYNKARTDSVQVFMT